jgi:hypothetical protein
VIDLVSSQVIWESCKGLFPISFVAANSQATVVADSKSFAICGTNDRLHVDGEIFAIGFLRQFLLIFRMIGFKKYVVDFYHSQVLLKTIKMVHRLAVVNFNDSVLVISSPIAFSILSFSNEPTPYEVDSEFISIDTRRLGSGIGGVFPIGAGDGDVLVHRPSKRLVESYHTDSVRIPKVNSCWYVGSPPQLFAHRSDKTIVHFEGAIGDVDFFPQFADGVLCYAIAESIQYGQATYQGRAYAPHFLARLIALEGTFNGLIETYRRRPNFHSILADALVVAAWEGFLDEWITYMLREFSNEETAKILETAVPYIKEHPAFYADDRWNWDAYLRLFVEKVQHMVLFALPPRRFAALKLQGVARSFLAVALDRGELMRAFLVALENGVDFAPVLLADAKFSELRFREAVGAFEEAMVVWQELDPVVPRLRSLGASFQYHELPELALAWFVAIRDESRASFVFEVDDAIEEVARVYVTEHPDMETSAFLAAVLSAREAA